MKLVSWNVNGIRACHKKGCFQWFFEYEPDIFCLQEIKSDAAQIPDDMKHPAGYQVFVDECRVKKGYSGVATYAKPKPEQVRYGIGAERFDREGRCIGIKYKDFWLFNVYVPNGSRDLRRVPFKLEYYHAFLGLLERLRKRGESVIFCGDINTAHREIDLARPRENKGSTGFLPEERAWLDKVEKLGYVDTFRHFYPNKDGAYTYWDQRFFARDRNVGWRLDYFFVSPDLISRVKSACIFDDALGSDHCPIGIEIR